MAQSKTCINIDNGYGIGILCTHHYYYNLIKSYCRYVMSLLLCMLHFCLLSKFQSFWKVVFIIFCL